MGQRNLAELVRKGLTSEAHNDRRSSGRRVTTGNLIPNRKARRKSGLNWRDEIQFAPPWSVKKRSKFCLDRFRMLSALLSAYLSAEWRASTIAQLEYLLEWDTWPEDTPFPKEESFMCYLGFTIYMSPREMPGLGIANSGNLMATWVDGEARLFVDFISPEEIRWSASQIIDGRREALAGQTKVDRLVTNLNGFSPQRWFVI
jgi:hypothetical protein